jgi:hypothetical protein
MRDYVITAKELQKMLLMLHTRSRAATTIQSVWRGWSQRRRWRPVWEAYVEQKQQLQAATVLQQVCRREFCCPAKSQSGAGIAWACFAFASGKCWGSKHSHQAMLA